MNVVCVEEILEFFFFWPMSFTPRSMLLCTTSNTANLQCQSALTTIFLIRPHHDWFYPSALFLQWLSNYVYHFKYVNFPSHSIFYPPCLNSIQHSGNISSLIQISLRFQTQNPTLYHTYQCTEHITPSIPSMPPLCFDAFYNFAMRGQVLKTIYFNEKGSI